MIARRYKLGAGKGRSASRLVSFDKALLEAGFGNYNLVRLSSILPAHCVKSDKVDIEEGSLLPVAYSTISSDKAWDTIVSTIGIGFPKDKEHVGVIMEYSVKNMSENEAVKTLRKMIEEAFECRGWELDRIEVKSIYGVVGEGETLTTFACVAEW